MESVTLSSILIIFLAIPIVTILAKRFHFPVIVGEIILGIILGKSLFNLIPENELFDFFSTFGLVFLMFLAGLEVDFDKVKRNFMRTILIAACSISVPFMAGYYLAPYANIHPYLLGTIFSTTSLGIILPLVRELKQKQTLRMVLLGSVIVVDIISMFILAFSLTMIEGTVTAGFFYSLAFIIILFFLPLVISRTPRIQKCIDDWLCDEDHFEKEVRFTFALIFVLGAVSETLGFHSIIGAFIAGLMIATTTHTAPLLQKKLEAIGFGFFVPLFFIIVGARVDLGSIFSELGNIKLLLIIIGAGIGAKVIGVSIMTLITGFNIRQSLAMGFFHAARLSLIIAAVEVAHKMGLIDSNLYSTIVLMAVASSIFGPAIGRAVLSSDTTDEIFDDDDEEDELSLLELPIDGPV